MNNGVCAVLNHTRSGIRATEGSGIFSHLRLLQYIRAKGLAWLKLHVSMMKIMTCVLKTLLIWAFAHEFAAI